ncbi:MAG: phosphotransferase [Parachlamydiaceae bacterium]
MIEDWLRDFYEIEAAKVELISVGADLNASIYKVQASDKRSYFVKVVQGRSYDVPMAILELLQGAGVQHLIHPIKTKEGKSAHQMGDLTLIVYPFIQGKDGFSRSLSDEQWIALGKALRQVHEIDVPAALQTKIRRENFSPKWREAVRSFFSQEVSAEDEIALKLRKFLKDNRALIQQLVDRSEELSLNVREKPLKFALCHSDIHGGNVLIDDKNALYIVDWDDPILAPKERDLMFIGGGVGNVWNRPHEEKLFYQGYGQTEVDSDLLAYYRNERIVVDIVEYIQELLLKPAESKDKFQLYHQFMDMFAPNGVVEIALK